jgi:hypothetical protein
MRQELQVVLSNNRLEIMAAALWRLATMNGGVLELPGDAFDLADIGGLAIGFDLASGCVSFKALDKATSAAMAAKLTGEEKSH